MSRIDDLIQELCPDGVERRPLGEFATLVRGNGMPKTDLVEEGVGAVHYGQIYTRYGVSATETFSFVSPEKAAKLAKVEPGDIIITNTSENIDDVGKALAWVGDAVIVTGGHATVIKHDQDSKFIAYWFASADFYAQKRKLATGTKVIDVSAKQLATVRIPVPPVEVQRAIVRVLDKFTQLEAELEAELEARRAQYEHYRDTLVSTQSVQWVKLADIGTFVRGRRFTKSDVVEAGIPSLHYGEIYTDYGTSATQAVRHVRPELRDQLRYALPGSVVFAGVGETVADVGKAVAWLGEEPIATHDDTFVFTSELDPKYVAYAVQTADFHRQKERHVSRAKVKRLSATGLGAIEIPVPSLKEQASVVRLLDKFDALVNDISIGLPAELAARRKQYEHYRDRLLTFKELAS